MARRYIGDAVVYILYHGSNTDGYSGKIVVKQDGKRYVWHFTSLYSPECGFPWPLSSPEAYDAMAESAVSFGSYYTSDNRGEDTPEWAPTPEVADAIDLAVGFVLADDGSYGVRRGKDRAHISPYVNGIACNKCGCFVSNNRPRCENCGKEGKS